MTFPDLAGGSAFFRPDGAYAAGARALRDTVRRESLLGNMLALIPADDPFRQSALLAEVRRRAELYYARIRETPDAMGDAFAAALESVTADIQKGLL